MLTGIDHICVATADLERAVRAWADRYGVGPWSIYTKDSSNMSARVDGVPTDFAMRVALASLPQGTRIEIIQPLDDRSPYAASLARHGGADHIHHVRFATDDYDADVARLGQHAILAATFAGEGGEFRGTYLATEDDLGLIVELGHAPDGFAMPPPERVYP